MGEFKPPRFNAYCYGRLKMEEFGTQSHDNIKINAYYERIYKVLDTASERLYTPKPEIPIRTNYSKTKKDYHDMVIGIIEEQNAEVGWSTMLAVFVGTKMMVRRYKERNPLFATMLCVDMWLVFNKLSSLWSFPKEHRVKLAERHIASLIVPTIFTPNSVVMFGI